MRRYNTALKDHLDSCLSRSPFNSGPPAPPPGLAPGADSPPGRRSGCARDLRARSPLSLPGSPLHRGTWTCWFSVEGGPAPREGTQGLGPLDQAWVRAGWKARASEARQVFWTRGLCWAAGPGLPYDLPTAVAPTGWAGVPRTHVTPIHGSPRRCCGNTAWGWGGSCSAASQRGAQLHVGGGPGRAGPRVASWGAGGLCWGQSHSRCHVAALHRDHVSPPSPSVVPGGGGGSLTYKVEATGQRSSAVDPGGISERDRRRSDKGSGRAELEGRRPGPAGPASPVGAGDPEEPLLAVGSFSCRHLRTQISL